MSKKGGKGKGKKGDEEAEEELRQLLKLDIETLENNIHLERMREVEAINDYNKLIEDTKTEQLTIEKKKNDAIKNLSIQADTLREEEGRNYHNITVLENTIQKLGVDINDLEKRIQEKSELYKKEQEDKDDAIKQQRQLFQEMTVRFQHILENTANKLQERVKMGS